VNLIAKDPLQRKIEIFNWVILAFVFIPSLIFGTYKFALGVLLGGFISIANFFWMGRSLQNVFQQGSKNIKASIVFKYFIRLALSAVVLYFLISTSTVNIIGLIIGLSVVVINVLLTTIITLSKKT